jgi:hypothetical protein
MTAPSCMTRIVDTWGIIPPATCGGKATEQIAFMCVHEHRREGYWCAACQQTQTEVEFDCRECADGPTPHDCPLTIVERTPLEAVSS